MIREAEARSEFFGPIAVGTRITRTSKDGSVTGGVVTSAFRSSRQIAEAGPALGADEGSHKVWVRMDDGNVFATHTWELRMSPWAIDAEVSQ